MRYSRSVSIKERYNSQKTIHKPFCLKSDRLKVNEANWWAQRVLNDNRRLDFLAFAMIWLLAHPIPPLS
jgi:hypothetical protein